MGLRILAIITASIPFMMLAFKLAIKIDIPIVYHDFITGYSVWSNSTKMQDLLVAPVLFLVGASVIALFLFGSRNLTDKWSADSLSRLYYYLVAWSVPALVSLVSVAFDKDMDDYYAAISLIGITYLLGAALVFYKKNPSEEDIDKVSLSLLVVFLASLIPISIAHILNTLPLGIAGGGVAIDLIEKYIIGVLIAGLLFALLNVAFGWGVFKAHCKKLALAAQLFLPFLFLSIYPARLVSHQGLLSYETTNLFRATVVILILIGLIDVIFRYRLSCSKKNFSLFRVISPFAVVAILTAANFGSTAIPWVSPDDYHFGESLLGWWVYLKGYLPYVDYIPAHGMIDDDLAGIVSYFFYDGTAASIRDAKRVVFSLLSIVAFLTLYFSTRSLLAAFLALYFLGASKISWFFLILIFGLWSNLSLLRNKIKWSLTWIILSPFVVIGVPPQGLIVVAATSIIPVYFLAVSILHKDWNSICKVSGALIFVALIFYLSPLGNMLYGAVQYVLVNGEVNQAAYGIPWEASFSQSSFVSEALRMSWFIVPFICFLVVLKDLYLKELDVLNSLPFLVLVAISFMLIPYSMGRIDINGVSRPGLVGVFLIAALFILLWMKLNVNNRAFAILFLTLSSSGLGFVNFSIDPLLASAKAKVGVGPLVDGPSRGLDNLGLAKVNLKHYDRLLALDKTLDSLLVPEETYLDLTSRNAHYFYTDRVPPTPVTAPYNIVSPHQQLTTIKELQNNLPRVVLMEANNINHDGGGLALRNPYLYKFIVDNYKAIKVNGFTFGLSKESISAGDWKSYSIPNNPKQMSLLEKAFFPNKNLRKLPVSWGASWSQLVQAANFEKDLSKANTVMHHVATRSPTRYEVAGKDPFVAYHVDDLNISGGSVDLLTFDFTCIGKRAEPVLQIFWWGGEQPSASEEFSLYLNAEKGRLVVPMSASPRWLQMDSVKGIRIDLHNANACEAFEIKNLSAYSYRKGA